MSDIKISELPVATSVSDADIVVINQDGTTKTAARSLVKNTGTVTSVTAGTGLSGGTITGSGTISVNYGTTSTTACAGDDARLSNARTPTAHKSTHATGGSDALAPSDIGAAPIDSPALTGTPTSTTAAAGTNTTQVATTAFVQANRGDKYLTASTTSNSLSLGAKTFEVSAGLAYTPTQDITVVYDNSNHMHGTVTSYSGTTLVVNITDFTGTGTYAVWTVNVGGIVGGSALQSANNLSDVANTATALTNIGGVPTSRTISTAARLSGGGDLTSNRTLDLATLSGLPTGAQGSATAIPQVTVDTYGRVTALTTAQLASYVPTSDLTTLATPNKVPQLDSVGALSTAQLATISGLPVGAQGSGSVVPVVTVDTKGRVTALTTSQLSVLSSQSQNLVLASPNGASGTPTFRSLVAADVPTLNQNTTGTAANVTGTVAVDHGGTGQTTYTDGQLLIGNTSGNTLTKATLTAGSGIAITNGNGSISIAATGGSGGNSFNSTATFASNQTVGIGYLITATVATGLSWQVGQDISLISSQVVDPGVNDQNILITGRVDSYNSGTGVIVLQALALNVTDGTILNASGYTYSIRLSSYANNIAQTGLSTMLGGTGISGYGYSDGELLIGNSVGKLTAATLTSGTGIAITNGDGAITIANSVPNTKVDIFTSSGTWTKPTGAKQVIIELVSGGNGGGAGGKGSAGTAIYGGSGGGAGGYSRTALNASDLDATCAVTVGGAGTGSIYGGAVATSGGSSSFANSSSPTLFLARAQSGGTAGQNGGTTAPTTGTGGAPNSNAGGTANVTGTGGAGSGASNAPTGGGAGGGVSTASQAFNGGNGATNPFINSFSAGGGGSSSASGSSASVAVTRSQSSLIMNGAGGGGGGASSFATGSGGNGAAGSGYGSGGGGGGATIGSGNGGNGGAGAPGIVIVTTYF